MRASYSSFKTSTPERESRVKITSQDSVGIEPCLQTTRRICGTSSDWAVVPTLNSPETQLAMLSNWPKTFDEPETFLSQTLILLTKSKMAAAIETIYVAVAALFFILLEVAMNCQVLY